MAKTSTPKFTLRFHNTHNHEILGLLADRYGISKNQLAEEMLERELQAAALVLEKDLTGTLDLLQNYRRDEHLQDAIAAFAEGEGAYADPIKTQMVEARVVDAFGVAEAFR